MTITLIDLDVNMHQLRSPQRSLERNESAKFYPETFISLININSFSYQLNAFQLSHVHQPISYAHLYWYYHPIDQPSRLIDVRLLKNLESILIDYILELQDRISV